MKDGLPKIALTRLKAEANRTSAASAAPEWTESGGHPDANLLAAFVEQSLTERERTPVLNHLSQCAECRQVAAFALPPQVAAPEPTLVVARRWNPWPVLRWGAMAAVLGAVTVVVVFHPDLWRHNATMSKVTLAPAKTGEVTAGRPTAPAAPPPNADATTRAEAQATGHASAVGMGGAKQSAASQGLALDVGGAQAKPKERQTVMAAVRPPAPITSENGPILKDEKEEAKGATGLYPGALPAPSPPAPAASPADHSAEPMARAEVAAKVAAPAQAAPPLLGAEKRSASEGAGSGTGAGMGGMMAPARPASSLSAQDALRKKSLESANEMKAARRDMQLAATRPSMQWGVSPNGDVQISRDGGKTYGPVEVSPGVRFRAIAALGDDVWAGGKDGALFHSSDGGATWTRVSLTSGGTAVTEAITAIQLRGAQHLTVTVASGAQWFSEDGGRHWEEKP